MIGSSISSSRRGSPRCVTFQPSPKLVTNTTGGKNQNPSIDKSGNLIVFTSNVNHASGVTGGPAGTFDRDGTGNDFTAAGATHPDPACATCTAGDDTTGQLFLWRRKASGATPANAIWEEAYRRAVGTGPAAFGSTRRGQA